MKYLKLSLLTLPLALIGCGDSGGGTSNKVAEFLRVNPQATANGLQMPGGDYAKFRIRSDDKDFNVEAEIKSQGQCYRANAKLPVALIGGNDPQGQAYDFQDLKIQIQPKVTLEQSQSGQFVHLIVKRNEKTLGDCSEAPRDIADQEELRSQQNKNLFSEFKLNASQLAMAPAAILRGSSTVMFYFRRPDLGLAFDSSTGALVGIDIPKQSLITDFLFTVNRSNFDTSKIASGSSFPLLLSDEDLSINLRAEDILQHLRHAESLAKDSDQAGRDFIVGNTWRNSLKN